MHVGLHHDLGSKSPYQKLHITGRTEVTQNRVRDNENVYHVARESVTESKIRVSTVKKIDRPFSTAETNPATQRRCGFHDVKLFRT